MYTFLFTLIAAIVIPWRAYSLTNRLLDTNPVFTEHRTLTFRPSGYTVVHSRGTTESTWDTYAGLSESAEFFFLRIPGSRLDLLIPKGAFTEEQMVLFRQCASRPKT